MAKLIFPDTYGTVGTDWYCHTSMIGKFQIFGALAILIPKSKEPYVGKVKFQTSWLQTEGGCLGNSPYWLLISGDHIGFDFESTGGTKK